MKKNKPRKLIANKIKPVFEFKDPVPTKSGYIISSPNIRSTVTSAAIKNAIIALNNIDLKTFFKRDTIPLLNVREEFINLKLQTIH